MKKCLYIVSFLAVLCLSGCTPEGKTKDMQQTRKAEYPIDDIFINRWSPRAMSGELVSDRELNTLFEAARWAPSSYNDQPWRFIYAKKDTPSWNTFFNFLVPFNQVWCKNASVLAVIVSKKTMASGKPSRTHSFDTGAAWENLSLQGSVMGLVVHGIGGFDYDKAQQELNVPDEYTVEAMCAVGRPGDAAVLPESMRKNEHPSGRKPLAELVFEGSFRK